MWEAIGVPHVEFEYSDTRVLTSSWDSRRAGHDPLVENPSDPWGRPMNYPRVWELPGFLGFGAGQTKPLVTALWLVFFAANLTLLLASPPRACWPYLPLLVSPSVALGLQRANLDLLVFAIAVGAALAVLARPRLATALVVLGFVLKLYPGVLAPILLRSRRGPRIAFLTAAGLILVALLLERNDIPLMRAGTFGDYGTSFGIDCVKLAFWPSPGIHWPLLGIQAGILIAPFAALALAGPLRTPSRSIPAIAYLAGSLLYCGSYVMLRTNYDYRLACLLLCVPSLADRGSGLGLASRCAVWALIAVSLWSPLFDRLAAQAGIAYDRVFVPVQAAEALLFAILGCGLIREFWPDVAAIFSGRKARAA